MKKLWVVLGLASVTHALAQGAGPKQAPVATPFGILVGTTTCKEAAPILGGEVEPASGGFVTVRSRGPGYHLAGATQLDVVCRQAEAPVHALNITVEPTDASSVSFMQTLRQLRVRYVETRRPPAPDDGMWEFETGNGKIVVFAFRRTSMYTVHYQSTAWVEFLRDSDARRKTEAHRKNEERDADKQSQLNKL